VGEDLEIVETPPEKKWYFYSKKRGDKNKKGGRSYNRRRGSVKGGGRKESLKTTRPLGKTRVNSPQPKKKPQTKGISCPVV